MYADTSDRWRFTADPRFESAADLDPATSAWVGHERFAYDLVRQAQPGTIVELGTHAGYSFFAFCQAVKDAGLSSSLFAVDTWTGDEQAGQYDEAVFDAVGGIVSRFYAEQTVELLKATFDEAVERFEDASIDLLHIDGLHTYEAVSHDFKTWLPKMDPRGIVLFHDIDETHDDFGVWRFWDEVKRDHESLEFDFGHGLGVLFLDADRAVELLPHAERTQVVRRYASAHAARLNAALTEATHAKQVLADETEAREEYQRQAETIPGLRVELERLAEAREEALKGWREEASAREKFQADTEITIDELRGTIDELREEIKPLRAEIEARGAAHEDALKGCEFERSLREQTQRDAERARLETERLFKAWKAELEQERAARQRAEDRLRGSGR